MKKGKAKDVILGQLRELLMITGSICWAHFEGMPSVVGLIVAIVAVAMSVKSHEGKEIIFTGVRKALTFIPACLVAFDLVPPDKGAMIATAIASAGALVWSAISNGGSKPKGLLPMIAACPFLFVSCAGGGISIGEDPIRLPNSGLILKQGEDGKAKIGADALTVTNWIGKFTRILHGEDPKDVILPKPPPSTIIPSK